MENQVLVGYRVFKKIQVQAGFRSTQDSTRKHLHRQQSDQQTQRLHVSTTAPNIPWPHNFSAYLSCDELQINQYLSLRLASTTADLIPYSFGSGIEEQIPVFPGQIQVPVPTLLGGALRQTDVLSRGGMTTPKSLHVIGKAPVVYHNTQKLCAVDPVTQFQG